MNRRRFLALGANLAFANCTTARSAAELLCNVDSATTPTEIYTYLLQSGRGPGISTNINPSSGAIFRGGKSAFDGTAENYDEVIAAACFQGLINRDAPRVYFLDSQNPRPEFWLKTLSQTGRWMNGKTIRRVDSIDSLRELASDRPKGLVIWDPEVPATINVASTVAAVEDGIVCSPEMAERVSKKWGLSPIEDLRGKFTGSETGSKKNDAYRWALREYLANGRCSSRRAFLSEDAFFTRRVGNPGYAFSRDWIMHNRSFVFDLSPWEDECPADDPEQRLGTDFETYRLILSELHRQANGQHMTEIVGFFSFDKYSRTEKHPSHHDPVPTELQAVWLMSPYGCYQSSISTGCYNQSFHCHYRHSTLQQRFHMVSKEPLAKKTYISVVMADYDSAGLLYEFLPRYWLDPHRGEIPLAWGINPNVMDSYPDLMEYFYKTATPNDTFTSDANAAGYMMVNRIPPEALPLFIEHNQRYFDEANMTIAPMVIDFDQPSSAAKDAYRHFARDGMASVIDDTRDGTGRPPDPQVWKGMPVMEMINDASASIKRGKFIGADQLSSIMADTIIRRGQHEPGFYLYRITWLTPSDIIATINQLRGRLPELNIELLDIHSFLSLFKERYSLKAAS